MHKAIVAANWKMNGNSAHCLSFCEQLKAYNEKNASTCQLVLFPASPYLSLASSFFTERGGTVIGAQSISQFDKGAYTGETSADMAADSGCQYALIGHSERRALFHETDDVVVLKTMQAIDAGLCPMICVGETLTERDNNETESVLKAQISPLLKEEKILQSGFVLAYEPVWAIGTGKAASPEQAEETHRYIRQLLASVDKVLAQNTPILYGGSVKPENANAIFAGENVDGALVGGASLEVQSFLDIAACIKSS